MFGSHRPEKSRSGKYWNRISPALGKSVKGWIVGPIVGLNTHYLNQTQPCRRDVTKGRMKCFCATMKLETVWKGYVPLFDEDGVQSFVVIGDTYADLAYALPLFTPVEVWRMRSAGSPIAVKRSDWTDQPPLHFGEALKPKDIKPMLLRLWKDTDLIDWIEAHPEAGDGIGEPGPLEKSVSPMLKAAARRAETPADVAKRSEHTRPNLPDTIGHVLPHVAGLNGRHKK